MDARQRVYLTVKQTAEKHPCMSENSIRWAIFHSSQNGFEKCIRRIGRKILICEDGFLEWIEGHKDAA